MLLTLLARLLVAKIVPRNGGVHLLSRLVVTNMFLACVANIASTTGGRKFVVSMRCLLGGRKFVQSNGGAHLLYRLVIANLFLACVFYVFSAAGGEN